ncbi:MAG: methyltransferase domain-containing protein [Candidatus Scalinduaceae bacterium]
MNSKCVICGSPDKKVVFKEFEVDILKCINCGHVFSSYKAEQDYDGFFGQEVESNDHFWWNEAHEKMYADFCNRFIIGKSGRLLDVGCGLGYFVRTMVSFPTWQTFGYEISKAAVEFAINSLKLDNISCGKVEASNFPEKYFDIITLWDVTEHIPHPDSLLSYLSSILKDKGFLFIHTPNNKIQIPKAKLKKLLKGMKRGISYLEAKDHINIYSMNTIKKVLQRNGFNNVKFLHLHPIQSISGNRNPLLKFIKNLWFYCSKIIFTITFRCININNLFVIAKK